MNKTVLIVDDSDLIRQSLTAALVSNDTEVIAAKDGKQGLELALDKKPDLIVTDVHMPSSDGLEMIDKIRSANDWGKKVPVLIMTVDEATESINKALEAGVTTYISKNVSDPAAIVTQIKNALG